MNYLLKKLDTSTFNELKLLVDKSLFKQSNPKLGSTSEYQADSTFFRVQNNKELAHFVNSITGFPMENINSFFHVRYNVGDKLPRHRDRSNHDIHSNPENSISFSFLLNMCDEGGEFYLDDNLIDFTTPGEYISFIGQDIFHEVKKVKKGTRDVLVIWYSPLGSKSIL